MRSFDLSFPTVRDIVEGATRIRSKFERTELQQAEWEKQYGAARPFDISELTSGDPHKRFWALDKEMWFKIKQHLKVRDFLHTPSVQIYRAKLELGYKLSGYEQEVLEASGYKPAA